MAAPPFLAIDHVQLAMPPGCEDRARIFYAQTLGMTELPKPPENAARGGCWFSSGDVQIHLGIEDSFTPARKAHPALVCSAFDALTDGLRQRGVEVRFDSSRGRRAYVDDPFGNRLELIEARNEGRA